MSRIWAWKRRWVEAKVDYQRTYEVYTDQFFDEQGMAWYWGLFRAVGL
jgi:hypothetical protein